jgi:hypothetical protein
MFRFSSLKNSQSLNLPLTQLIYTISLLIYLPEGGSHVLEKIVECEYGVVNGRAPYPYRLC